MQRELFDESKNKKSGIMKSPGSGNKQSISELSGKLLEAGVLTNIDLALAEFLKKKGEANEDILLAISLVSAANRLGHSSLDLNRLNTDPASIFAQPGRKKPQFGDFTISEERLRSSPVTGNAEQDPETKLPVVLEKGRLYFNRYFNYEHDIAARLLAKAGERITNEKIPDDELKEWFEQLFDPGAESLYQKVAAAASLNRRLTVVTGGPGTGKTHAVLRILVLLMHQAGEDGLRVAIAAPTGKAANRVRESLIEGMEKLLESEIAVKIHGLTEAARAVPLQAQTIHRLLGVRYRSAGFRYNKTNPLPYDIVIVDEASMIDMALMSKLLEALSPQARLIMLGDKNQLSSVESGAVFADICSRGDLRKFTGDFSAFCGKAGITLPGEDILQNETKGAMTDSIVELVHSRRFTAGSGIGRLARLINSGNAQGAIALLEEGLDDVIWMDTDPKKSLKSMKDTLNKQFETFKSRKLSDSDKLRAMAGFQLLCAHRRGPGGVEELNGYIENLLGVDKNKSGEWYEGRPVMMTTNDYQLDVFNGDVGVTVAVPQIDIPERLETSQSVSAPALRIALEEFDYVRKLKTVRLFPVTQLQQMETCWALSVHKSQGSEYDTVLFALPDQDSPVLTRELIYTAVTRAKKKVIIAGSREMLKRAIHRKTLRFSGLAERLDT